MREEAEGERSVLYLSCVVQQEASSAVSVLSIARRETPLTNQRSLLVTQTLHTTVEIMYILGAGLQHCLNISLFHIFRTSVE